MIGQSGMMFEVEVEVEVVCGGQTKSAFWRSRVEPKSRSEEDHDAVPWVGAVNALRREDDVVTPVACWTAPALVGCD